MRYVLIILLGLGLFSACNSKDQGEVLAEVFGEKLYESDIEALFNDGMSLEDSVFIRKEFINNWVSTQVVLHESREVLTAQEQDKSEQIRSYREDLLAYETLNKLAVERIDTQFSVEELQSYYDQNLKEFELSQNIIKVVFIKLPKALEDIDDLWQEFRRGDVDLQKMKNMAVEFKGNYSIDTSSWVYFDDVLKELPINTYNQEHYLNNNKNIKINEGPFVYFVKILDFRIKSGRSPFEMEKERIRKILFIKQQEAMLQTVENELIDKAYNNDKIIIH